MSGSDLQLVPTFFLKTDFWILSFFFNPSCKPDSFIFRVFYDWRNCAKLLLEIWLTGPYRIYIYINLYFAYTRSVSLPTSGTPYRLGIYDPGCSGTNGHESTRTAQPSHKPQSSRSSGVYHKTPRRWKQTEREAEVMTGLTCLADVWRKMVVLQIRDSLFIGTGSLCTRVVVSIIGVTSLCVRNHSSLGAARIIGA